MLTRWLRRRWALIEVTLVPVLRGSTMGSLLHRVNGERVVSRHWTLRGARIAKMLAEENQINLDAHDRSVGRAVRKTEFMIQPLFS